MENSAKSKIKISNLVKTELPEMHSKLIKKLKGKHNLINNFIYIPDIIGGLGVDNESEKALNKSIYNVNEYMKTGNIKYELIGFSFKQILSSICCFINSSLSDCKNIFSNQLIIISFVNKFIKGTNKWNPDFK